MILKGDKVSLRPTGASDITNYQRWLIDDPDPEKWDVSWDESDDGDDSEIFMEQLKKSVGVPREIYHHFEVVESSGRHVGWVNAYFRGSEKDLCVGIDLPDAPKRRGYGEQALALFLAYLFTEYRSKEIYANTLSGNIAMVHLAEKIGFEIKHTIPSVRKLRGQAYDGLAFSITDDTFWGKYP